MEAIRDALMANAASRGATSAATGAHGTLSWREFTARVAARASSMASGPRTIGVYGVSGPDWSIAQLAAAISGRRLVPLPTFFAASQIVHIVRDAGIELVLADSMFAPRVVGQGVAVSPLETLDLSDSTLRCEAGFQQIIYTSGSTGTPKGVVHGEGQVLWSTRALAAASGARADDVHLSVLPCELLLEAICGIFVPTLVGAHAHFAPQVAAALATRRPVNLADIVERVRPTTSVLVPQLLDLWSAQLRATERSAPASLRFVAVGGAAVPARPAAQARARGIPLSEGYGLSECCSVVAVNRPDACRPGTVGRPLPGLVVTIDDGEIVVAGPSVMDNYLDSPPHEGPWRTGDMGSIDVDGFLTIEGRRDNLIVTAGGRNVSPEWVETELASVARGALPTVVPDEGQLGLLCIGDQSSAIAVEALQTALAALPRYAQPCAIVALPAEEAAAEELFTPNGRIRRARAAQVFAQRRAAATPIVQHQDQH